MIISEVMRFFFFALTFSLSFAFSFEWKMMAAIENSDNTNIKCWLIRSLFFTRFDVEMEMAGQK